MNLFDLAHHPDAFDPSYSPYGEFGVLNPENSTDDQFSLMLENASQHLGVRGMFTSLTENEYRMFLLFIHWSTES